MSAVNVHLLFDCKIPFFNAAPLPKFFLRFINLILAFLFLKLLINFEAIYFELSLLPSFTNIISILIFLFLLIID